MNSLSKKFLNHTIFLSVSLLALFAVLVPNTAQAQGYGSIVGNVADTTGAAVAGATVTVTQVDTGRQTMATSGQSGGFVFPTLPPAAYSLSIASKGFQTYDQTGIVLQADQSGHGKCKAFDRVGDPDRGSDDGGAAGGYHDRHTVAGY